MNLRFVSTIMATFAANFTLNHRLFFVTRFNFAHRLRFQRLNKGATVARIGFFAERERVRLVRLQGFDG